MPDGITIDAHDLRDLSTRLRRGGETFRVEVQRELVEIGTLIKTAAEKEASQYSQTVAATIRMRPTPGAVIIEAGSNQVPIAALWEVGNKGSKRSSPTFRHPVFGNQDVWVDQPRHPFLRPAVTASRPLINKRMDAAVDRTFQKMGFH